MKKRERLAAAVKLDPRDEAKYKALRASEKGGLYRLFRITIACEVFLFTPKISVRITGAGRQPIRSDLRRTMVNAGDDEYMGSDLQFNQDIIRSKGFLEHGIIVSLGYVRVEDVKLSDPPLKFLVDIKPATTRPDAKILEAQLDRTITSGKYTYSNAIIPNENTTYAMRVIAYRLEGFNGAHKGLKFTLVRADRERADLTVIFRVIRRGTDGSLTILLRELQRKRHP